MAQAIGFKEYNRFIRGLISEATPLNFPEDASIDESNFVLHRSGMRTRRLGMDFEPGYELYDVEGMSVPPEGLAVETFLWTAETSTGALEILVVQIGNMLHFFVATANAISSAPLGDPLQIGEILTSPCQFVSMYGDLIVANGQKGVIRITIDPDTFEIAAEPCIILVRDIWGVDDGRSIKERTPAGQLDSKMEYNLVNQGWGDSDEWGPYYIAALSESRRQLGEHPSNSDIASAAQDPTDDLSINTALLRRSLLGTSPAPKGSFVIDAFHRGTSRYLMMTGKTLSPTRVTETQTDLFAVIDYAIDKSDWEYELRINTEPDLPFDASGGPANLLGGISCVASYAGRVWFSGASSFIEGGDSKSPSIESFIYFSQVCDTPDRITRCYQENDPTAGEAPDIVDSDGGAVKIPDMQRVQKMVPIGRSLIVFAQNGIWEISGGESNFSATSFEIRKVADTVPISINSIVEMEGILSFWADEGIYLLGPDEISGRSSIKNMTEQSIQTWYASLPREDKRNCRGVFDPVERKIRWLYGEKKNPAFKLTSKPYPSYTTEWLSSSAVLTDFENKTVIIEYGSHPAENLILEPQFLGFLITGPQETGEELEIAAEVIEIKLTGPTEAPPEELELEASLSNIEFSVSTFPVPEELDVEPSLTEIVLI